PRAYDSTAAAAIASQAGCREGGTYVRSTLRSGHPITGLREEIVDDSGADSLRALGMIVREFDRIDASRLQGFARAEFFINAAIAMTDATTALMADALAGSVFVSGRHGERYWGPTRRGARGALADGRQGGRVVRGRRGGRGPRPPRAAGARGSICAKWMTACSLDTGSPSSG